jgi:hypothetical protein
MPSLQCSLAELMLGLVINPKPTPATDAVTLTTVEQIGIHQAYTQQKCLDGYAHTIEYAAWRKCAFNRRLLAKFPREVIFKIGQLVQVYCNDLTYTFKTECKLLPHWSPPQRIVNQDHNSYHLETLEGVPIPSTFSSRHLRRFLPRPGTQLAQLRAAVVEGESEDEIGVESNGEDVLDAGDGIVGRMKEV